MPVALKDTSPSQNLTSASLSCSAFRLREGYREFMIERLTRFSSSLYWFKLTLKTKCVIDCNVNEAEQSKLVNSRFSDFNVQ